MGDASNQNRLDLTAQIVRALVLYSLAEFQAGYASTIRVSAAGASFSVADNGRGHAIDKTVDGAPYLRLVYTHLEYPFALGKGGPVQLQGIGMSLLNVMCSELSVTVRKAQGTLKLKYKAGRLCQEERVELPNENTGNTVVGTVSSHLQTFDTNVECIKHWLAAVAASNPPIKLHFNGRELHAPQPSVT